MGQQDAPDSNPSIPAADEGELGGRCILPHPDLPFEEREPGLVDYQPDLGGAIEGDC